MLDPLASSLYAAAFSILFLGIVLRLAGTLVLQALRISAIPAQLLKDLEKPLATVHLQRRHAVVPAGQADNRGAGQLRGLDGQVQAAVSRGAKIDRYPVPRSLQETHRCLGFVMMKTAVYVFLLAGGFVEQGF